MEEGVLVRWLKPTGTQVQIGDALYELEGEKSVQEIESLEAGVLHIPADGPTEGSTVAVGALLGYVLAPGEKPPGIQPPVETVAISTAIITDLPPVAPSVRRLARKLGVNLSDVKGTGHLGRIVAEDLHGHRHPNESESVPESQGTPAQEVGRFASPRARRAARQLGVDWQRVAGTGRGGRVRERDVLNLAHTQKVGSVLPDLKEERAISLRRKTIAARMLASQQRTAAVTLTSRADATELVRLRSDFKVRQGEVAPSYTDLIAKLTESALRRHPILAATWQEDRAVLPDVSKLSIGVAVDTPDGLLVGVVRDVANLRLAEVARISRELAERARLGKLGTSEMEGAAMTITNLGAWGIDAFTPIIPYPQAAILGLGAIRREPVVVDEDKIAIRSMMTLSLTFDHRIVDGAPAAQFLQDLVGLIEKVSPEQVGA